MQQCPLYDKNTVIDRSTLIMNFQGLAGGDLMVACRIAVKLKSMLILRRKVRFFRSKCMWARIRINLNDLTMENTGLKSIAPENLLYFVFARTPSKIKDHGTRCAIAICLQQRISIPISAHLPQERIIETEVPVIEFRRIESRIIDM